MAAREDAAGAPAPPLSANRARGPVEQLVRDAEARRAAADAAGTTDAVAAAAGVPPPATATAPATAAPPTPDQRRRDALLGIALMAGGFLLLAAVALVVFVSVGDEGGRGPPGWVRDHYGVLQRGLRRSDVQVEAHVTLRELATGAQVNVTYVADDACPSCGGAGGSGSLQCPSCGGSGRRVIFGGMMQQTCPRCGGRGVVHAHTCGRCSGSGVAPALRLATLTLSPGLQGGDSIRLVGAGGVARGERGDVIVTLVEKAADADDVPDGVVARCRGQAACPAGRNDDLHVRLRISLAEAVAGWRRVVRHPRGALLDIRVPSGTVTQPGTVLRYVGDGMPRRTAAAGRRSFTMHGGAAVHELQLPGAPREPPPAAASALCRLPAVGALLCPSGDDAYGTLFATVEVDLPPSLSPTQVGAIERAFPAPPPHADDDEL